MVKQILRKPLRAEEADQLCQACSTMLEKLVIWTMLDTGLRVSELCALKPENILWQQKTLRISGKGNSKENTKHRVVPISIRIQTLLEHYFAINEGFPIGVRQAQKIVKYVANKAKIALPITPHVLRHTFATLAFQKGISIAAVQKVLGHARLETTAIYLNFTDPHVIEEFTRKW